MGEKKIRTIQKVEDRQVFMKHLLQDLKALEMMLAEDRLEKDGFRIGAEQEINFIDKLWRPAPIGTQVLESLKGKDGFTSEFSRFNFEINLPPKDFTGNCLKQLEKDLWQKLKTVEQEANRNDGDICITGILPTIRRSDIKKEVITPEPRYKTLYELIRRIRGRRYEYHIKGIDELITRDDFSVFGGCTTSFQVHLQMNANELAHKFNWAQAISGPLLACATNSPMFLGKRLWHETRIALFQQATDVRQPYNNINDKEARVCFGNDWVENSIMEVFQDIVANYRVLLVTDIEEDSLEMVRQGKAPSLKALNLHNGSIYMWNRPCYGILNGMPALRIENRILPAGPTVKDQVANASFWLGMMHGMPDLYQNIHQKVDFAEIKNNFLKAARLGLEVKFRWMDNQLLTAQELILEELLPIARYGLQKAGVDEEDSHSYLSIIDERVKTMKTGSAWVIKSFTNLVKDNTYDEALVITTAGMVKRQKEGNPVHTWDLPQPHEAEDWRSRFGTIEQIMSTSLYTVREDDVVDLAANIMNWKKIAHIPVENKHGQLVGLITKDTLINFLFNDGIHKEEVSVQDVMITDLITVDSKTSVSDAIDLMLENKISCLPVIEDNRVIGIVTEYDFVHVSRHLFKVLSKESVDMGKDIF
jgi:CBS domain-containing protein